MRRMRAAAVVAVEPPGRGGPQTRPTGFRGAPRRISQTPGPFPEPACYSETLTDYGTATMTSLPPPSCSRRRQAPSRRNAPITRWCPRITPYEAGQASLKRPVNEGRELVRDDGCGDAVAGGRQEDVVRIAW